MAEGEIARVYHQLTFARSLAPVSVCSIALVSVAPISAIAFQDSADPQRVPLTLEPVRRDETSLAAKAQPLQEAVHRAVALVGLGEHAMHPVALEEDGHY
ncbi:MAG: hypothetical protein JO168_05335 [Solirubrobacterales bacterium]|nr:hypothetical protein [Solirubrobacterales bacterium]